MSKDHFGDQNEDRNDPFVEDENVGFVQPRFSRFLLLVVGFVVLFFFVLAYFWLVQRTTQAEIASLQEESGHLQEQIDDFTPNNVAATQRAGELLVDLDENQMLWSKILRDVLLLLPKDPSTGLQTVEFLSYSGNTSGALTFNGRTTLVNSDPYSAVAQLIRTFTDSSVFSDVFVPTLATGRGETGESVASFVLNLNYNDQ